MSLQFICCSCKRKKNKDQLIKEQVYKNQNLFYEKQKWKNMYLQQYDNNLNSIKMLYGQINELESKNNIPDLS